MKNIKTTPAEQPAQVNLSQSLCEQELAFLKSRDPIVKEALEKAIGITLENKRVPRIALCASGGGIRATLTTLGALAGSNIPNTSLNIMDIATYFSTLSGSTWALTGLEYSQLSPEKFINHLAPQLNDGLLNNFNMKDLAVELKKKEHYNQPTSFVNIYGILIAQKILKNFDTENPSAIELTACTHIFDKAKMPLSIKTAVIGNDDLNEWVEFTPYQVGSSYLKTFIPTWAFGKKFENGSSVDSAPPQSAGFCLGIWSSAMCLDPKDFVKFVVTPNLDTVENDFLQNILAPIFIKIGDVLSKFHLDSFFDLNKDISEQAPAALSQLRISPSQIFNWNLNIPGLPLNTEKTLNLVDAGHAFNFPLPPLLSKERAVDIIIIIDASNTPIAEWDNTEKYINDHHLPFPTIDRTQFNKACSVFSDSSNDKPPVIIYLPLIKNNDYENGWNPWENSFTGTFNMLYTQEETRLLTGLAQKNMEQSMPIILDTIKQWIIKNN